MHQDTPTFLNWLRYITFSDDKHRKVRDSSKSALEIQDKFSPRQNAIQEFFSDGWKKNCFWTEFCLGLNFVLDRICLRLNFVLDYIAQLYFIYNLLICLLFACARQPEAYDVI